MRRCRKQNVFMRGSLVDWRVFGGERGRRDVMRTRPWMLGRYRDRSLAKSIAGLFRVCWRWIGSR